MPHTLSAAGRELAALYRPLVERGPRAAQPWVIGHLGQSLDGFIATRNGDSRYVTGEADLDHMHRLRALADAVIVGAGTVAIDDPLLTTRRVPGRNATRAVLDPLARLPRTARVLQGDDAPTLWLVDERWCDQARGAGAAARVLAVPGLLGSDGMLDAHAAVHSLAQQGLQVLFVEGGGVTVSRFLAQGVLDRLHLTLAPVLIGEGRRGVRLPASGTMADCLRPGGRTVRRGEDVLWDFDLAPRHQVPDSA
ncbi:MAG: RibD family protein [Rubrivivax sp.]